MSEAREHDYLDAIAVAARIGVAKSSVWEYIRRGDIPEPDVVWLGKKLWLVETIDAWRSQKYVRRHKRIPLERQPVPRPTRPPAVLREGARMPAKPKSRRKTTRAGALEKPAVSSITEEVAQEVAAGLRADGVTCTSADVMVLVDAVDVELDHGQQQLQQRIQHRLARMST